MRLLPLVALALAACADGPTGSAADGAPEGRWVAPAVALQPRGTLRTTLTLLRDGRFGARSAMYGAYDGEAAGALSSVTLTTGSYTVSGDRIEFRAESLVTWDAFYGESEPTVTTPYPYGGVFDDCRFERRGDELVLRFLTYPLDAPVPTVATFRRLPTVIFD